MVLKLNVLQRLLINGFMNDYAKSGLSLTEMNKALKLVEKLAFKDEEQKELNVRLESVNEAGEPLPAPVYRWNRVNEETKEEVDVPREVDFSNEQSALLKDVLSKKNDNKEFTLENGPIMFEVAKELGISIE